MRLSHKPDIGSFILCLDLFIDPACLKSRKIIGHRHSGKQIILLRKEGKNGTNGIDKLIQIAQTPDTFHRVALLVNAEMFSSPANNSDILTK
jgi:hypothetical protein